MLGYLQVGPVGSRGDTTLFIRHAEGIRVRCGCFAGEISEFEARISEVYRDDKYGKQYMATIAYVKTYWEEWQMND